MKKIDLHIHTLSTGGETSFDFSLEKLSQYVGNRHLDCIAITNHNRFDLSQFNSIASAISVRVLPGIEVDLDGGQILVIADDSDPEDFAEKCQQVWEASPNKKDSLSVSDLKQIFGDLSNYILIPHYEKNPRVGADTLQELGPVITAGEVSSPKKFMYCVNDQERLVPVYFSDSRMAADLETLPSRQTYISCEQATFSAIRSCLRDKSKVALSESEGNAIFEVFDDGQVLSTGLNVIIGERSSGKSHTLKRIHDTMENVKLIAQFSLVERDEGEDAKKFNKTLSEGQSLLSLEFLDEFRVVVQDVIDIDVEEADKAVDRYVQSLLKHAEESEKHDTFSKAKLFSEEKFPIESLKGLQDLIGSTKNLIENVEFRTTIEKHVSIESLKALIVELMREFGRREQERLKKRWLNGLIGETKRALQTRTAATPITDVDLYAIAMNRQKVEKFSQIVNHVRAEREISSKPLQGFEIVANAVEFQGAGELKTLSRSKNAFADAFSEYEHPYEYLQELKRIDGLEEAEYYKYFVRIEYKILNKDGFEVSGGERSEFNLLREVQDARKYDMLLIDEPESSFDNLFLKSAVNSMIKSIAGSMPVVLVTHNNTVGASVSPDYLLYTKKEMEGDSFDYRIYSGFPTSLKLNSTDGKSIDTYDVTIGCLEAGEEAYDLRRRGYEDIKN